MPCCAWHLENQRTHMDSHIQSRVQKRALVHEASQIPHLQGPFRLLTRTRFDAVFPFPYTLPSEGDIVSVDHQLQMENPANHLVINPEANMKV